MANEIRNSVARGIQRSPEVGFDIQAIIEGLRNGDAGPAVNALQSFLNQRLGAGLKLDGKFGPKTEAALKQFQESVGCGGSGIVDARTLDAIQGRQSTEATASAVGCEPKAAPSPEAQAASRTKTRSAEELMRSRVDGSLRAQAAGENYEIVSDADVNEAAAQLGALGTQTMAQKAQVGQMRAQIEGEVKALEAMKGRTPADDALLEGKRAQASVLGDLERQLDLKKEGFDAAFAAVSDGVVTDAESQGIQQWSEIVQQKDQLLQQMANNADRMVALATEGGAQVPTGAALVANAPSPTATPSPSSAPSPANAPVAAATIKPEQVRGELKDLRAQIGERRADLDILKSASPKDGPARARHQAEVGLKEQELKLLQKRAADLAKADEALQKGPLSAADTAALRTSKEQLVSQQKTLAAGKAAFDDVGALKAKMEKSGGSVDKAVKEKRAELDDANAALTRAQSRGNPDAVRAAFARAEQAKAELGAATRSQALIDKTLQALGDGEIDAAEKKTLDGMQKAIDDAKARSASMEKRLPELDKQKHFGSDLADRVFSWFASSAETEKTVRDYGRTVLV